MTSLLLPGTLGLLCLTSQLTSCQTLTTEISSPSLAPQASQEQVVRQAVCKSFETIDYSAKADSPPTVAEVRRHNAALRTYHCETLK